MGSRSVQLLAVLFILGDKWLCSLVAAQKPSPCQCSRIAVQNRKNCGFPGITPETCFGMGCCFDSTVPNVPWCFHSLPKQEAEQCVMEVSARRNCGYPGISPQECASRKCCFSDTIVNVPWCFFPMSVEGNVLRGGGWEPRRAPSQPQAWPPSGPGPRAHHALAGPLSVTGCAGCRADVGLLPWALLFPHP
ncbi:hypothetical protein GH733_017448 [Mirounga leonina]|nr:hypothetical protein GH733_017448 [Mirounga leonina]